MKKILIGLLFALVSVRVSSIYINFTPAFVGYLFIFLGLGEGWDTPSRSASRTIALGAAVISAVLWAVGLFGYGTIFPVEATLQIVVTYRLLRWCEEQEDWEWGYRIQRLRLAWYALTGSTVAAFALGLSNAMLWLVWTVASLLAAGYYIFTFYRLRRLAPEEFQG